MTVNLSTNINPQSINGSNDICETKPAALIKNILDSNKTDLNLSKTLFNESLSRKYNRTGFFKGFTTMEGSINDKSVYLKKDYQRTGIFSGVKTYSGVMGEEKAEITINGKNISGKIGDKEINLIFDKGGIFKPYLISGIIDDKEISITKGTSLDEAKGENDILTLISSLSGNAIKVKDGKFGKLSLSKQASIDQAQANTNMQQQMAMNNNAMGLTW